MATVEADAFCQAMVRSLVGALLAVGDGRRPVDWPASLLDPRASASSEVIVAPAHGLTLVAVGYPDDPADYARRAELTRRLRVPVEGSTDADSVSRPARPAAVDPAPRAGRRLPSVCRGGATVGPPSQHARLRCISIMS